MKSFSDQISRGLPGRARLAAYLRRLCVVLGFAMIVPVVLTALPAESETAGVKPGWKFEIETSGGLTGKGDGGVSIDSSGGVSASTRLKTCQDRLTPQENKKFKALVTRAKPAKWKKLYARSGNPRGAADQFLYAAKLSTAGPKGSKLFEASWYDDSREILPTDLNSLVDLAWQIRTRAIAGCKP
jgi:hypothetical protein